MTGERYSLRPMAIGAEVVGLAAGDEEDPATRAALYEAWLEHGFLLFKNVDSIDRHLSLTGVFGELEIHPFIEARSKVHPLLIDIGGERRYSAYVYDEGEPWINRIVWHRDTAYTPDLCKGAMLRMLEVPAADGETMLCDTAKAYDDLPAAMKARLEGLEYKATHRLGPIEQNRPGAFWKTVRLATTEEDPIAGGKEMDTSGMAERYPPVIHPAVRCWCIRNRAERGSSSVRPMSTSSWACRRRTATGCCAIWSITCCSRNMSASIAGRPMRRSSGTIGG
jgi:taurine dioxygenase